MSDLVGNHIVGFPMRRLKYVDGPLKAIKKKLFKNSAFLTQNHICMDFDKICTDFLQGK